MNLQQHKEIIRQLFETGLNQRKFELINQFIHADYTNPTVASLKGPDAFKAQVTDLIKANPDIQWTIHELIAEDNKVWARWTTTTGEGSAHPAKTAGMGTYVISNGQIIASAALIDRLSFFQQKNLIPKDLNILQAKASPNKLIFIDKFVVPAASLSEFKQRVKLNRALIEKIPGFIEDAAYETTDANGNTLYLTIAEWASAEALQRAKETIQAKYQQEGFDIAAMMKRLNITLDRAVYTPAADN